MSRTWCNGLSLSAHHANIFGLYFSTSAASTPNLFSITGIIVMISRMAFDRPDRPSRLRAFLYHRFQIYTIVPIVQRPYWYPKTMKRRPCWGPKPILWELNSFLLQTLSFVPTNLHRCWPREWKHSIDLIHDTRHLCTRLRTDGIKAMSRGFSGGKQVINFSNARHRGWTTFYIKDDNGKLWVEVIIFTFLDAVATVRYPHSRA